MEVIGIDLGGTKVAGGIISSDGKIVRRNSKKIKNRSGRDVGGQIRSLISTLLADGSKNNLNIGSLGISLPGIYYSDSGRAWAPNIAGWEEYPLLEELSAEYDNLSINIDSDRAAYILGETWQGVAQGSRDAIFIAVGTGIGAGIMVDGDILRGAHDIAGATGWMALNRPFKKGYEKFGCFEYHASGDGLARSAIDLIEENQNYKGPLRKKGSRHISSYDIFREYDNNDPIAKQVIKQAIVFWGMATANFISLFNPEIIVFGGGIFGPAERFLMEIKKEAERWAQPIAFQEATFATTALGEDAGLVGAGKLAYNAITKAN